VKPAQVPQGHIPDASGADEAPGRVSGEAASTDTRVARTLREKSVTGSVPLRPIRTRYNPEIRWNHRCVPQGLTDSRNRAALPPSRTAWPRPRSTRKRWLTDSIHRPDAQSPSHHAPGPGGDSRGGGSPPKPNPSRRTNPSPRPVSGTRHPRFPERNRGCDPFGTRTGEPVGTVHGQAPKGTVPDREIRTKRWCFARKTSRRVPRFAPRTELAAPPAMRWVPKNPPRIR
jgi:hypothetical protein